MDIENFGVVHLQVSCLQILWFDTCNVHGFTGSEQIVPDLENIDGLIVCHVNGTVGTDQSPEKTLLLPNITLS